MEVTSVTSKGQVTIPKELRQQLGIRQGSRIEFSLVGDHVEMRVRSSPSGDARREFGMLKSLRTPCRRTSTRRCCSGDERPGQQRSRPVIHRRRNHYLGSKGTPRFPWKSMLPRSCLLRRRGDGGSIMNTIGWAETMSALRARMSESKTSPISRAVSESKA